MDKEYKLSDFDYKLPPNLIAQTPMKPRDHSRLLVLHKDSGKIEERYFYDIIGYLKPGDMLVLNNSKVFPARLIGRRCPSGGRIEVFLHRFIKDKKWNCLIGGRRAKVGLKVEFADKTGCMIKKNNHDGTWEIEFNKNYQEMMAVVEKIGQAPLPPYIVKSRKLKVESREKEKDKENYQTVYADDKKIGSVAAPTAGLHFTPELLEKIREKGVRIEYITLHVGLGTFAPVKTDDISQHKMHYEFVEIEKAVIERINQAKERGNRVITVGTTSTRALEAFYNYPESYELRVTSYESSVNIFIRPGYEFKIIDGIITNFHLPKSTLLMLVSALAGKGNIEKAYKIAMKKNYRFYSYGDAMLVI